MHERKRIFERGARPRPRTPSRDVLPKEKNLSCNDRIREDRTTKEDLNTPEWSGPNTKTEPVTIL